MNICVPDGFVPVTRVEFDRALDRVNYRRESFANGVEYSDFNGIVAVGFTSPTPDEPRWFVHPALVAERSIKIVGLPPPELHERRLVLAVMAPDGSLNYATCCVADSEWATNGVAEDLLDRLYQHVKQNEAK